MAIQKIEKYDEYQFAELRKNHSQNVENYDFQEIEFQTEDFNFRSLIDEADRANSSDFMIDQDVFELRKIKLAKKNELEKKIEDRISDELKKIKEKAYAEGYQQGLVEGKEKAYIEEKSATDQKIFEMNAIVDNLLARNDELIKTQDKQIIKLLRDFTKWIILKELEKDDEYIIRLANKMLEENKKNTIISFQIGHGVAASFKNALGKLSTTIEEMYDGKVEVIESATLEKDAIEVEVGSSLFKADFSEQLRILDQVFDSSNGDR